MPGKSQGKLGNLYNMREDEAKEDSRYGSFCNRIYSRT
jgi:hypothetical protein